LHKGLLIVVLLTMHATAWAEGRCPPGQYPTGGSNGVLGCAPIPGANGETAQPPPPVPTGKWESRWGAIAVDEDVPVGAVTPIGVAVSRKSKQDARGAALDACSQRGGKRCVVRLAYHDQCAVIADLTSAIGSGKRSVSYFASAETTGKAEALGLKECAAANGGAECEIVYSACSVSDFKPYR